MSPRRIVLRGRGHPNGFGTYRIGTYFSMMDLVRTNPSGWIWYVLQHLHRAQCTVTGHHDTSGSSACQAIIGGLAPHNPTSRVRFRADYSDYTVTKDRGFEAASEKAWANHRPPERARADAWA